MEGVSDPETLIGEDSPKGDVRLHRSISIHQHLTGGNSEEEFVELSCSDDDDDEWAKKREGLIKTGQDEDKSVGD